MRTNMAILVALIPLYGVTPAAGDEGPRLLRCQQRIASVASTFLTQRRRVTVTMTSATVANLHEPELPFWDWRPGEIVFESRVTSPAVERRWGVREPLCVHLESGGAAPLRRFGRDGETQAFESVVFDDFVLPEETALDLALRAYDVDFDPHYGVYETVSQPYLDDLGGGTLAVSTLAPGTYTFYPFEASAGVLGITSAAPMPLSIAPNPARGALRITPPAAARGPADLDIFDVSGRLVRHAAAIPADGYPWDGRDAAGRLVRTGLYLVRVVTAGGTWQGRSCIVH